VRVRTPEARRFATVLTENGLHAEAGADDGLLLVHETETARVGNLAFTNQVELHELSSERGDLEQVFLEITGEAAAAAPEEASAA